MIYLMYSNCEINIAYILTIIVWIEINFKNNSMNKNKYQFGTYNEISDDTDINKVVQEFTYNLLSQQCGWTDKECKKKAIDEINRDIPKRIFNYLELYGWNLDGSKILDVGSGQGGAVLEALYRGADASSGPV